MAAPLLKHAPVCQALHTAMGSWETWQLRPARRQVDEATLQRDTQLKKANELPRNAWSGKVHRQLTGEEKGAQRHDRVKERSRFRCMPEVDCGRTKGSQAQQKMFCLYFAKGCCSQGVNCLYLHRLPTQEDEAYHCKDMGADIFGREKRAEHEGFHKGAGTIERDNRCLYVNYEGAGAYEVPKIRELLEANFGQWGPIKNIYIKHVTTIAFVKYEWRSSAEFAKEAMHKQGLLGSSQAEVLTVRWSNEDPNPVAIVRHKREHRDRFQEAVMTAWEALPEEQQQQRIHQLQLAAAIKRQQVVSCYPNTDGQFSGSEPQESHTPLASSHQQQQQQQGRGGLQGEGEEPGGTGQGMRGAWQAAMQTGSWVPAPAADEDPGNWVAPERQLQQVQVRSSWPSAALSGGVQVREALEKQEEVRTNWLDLHQASHQAEQQQQQQDQEGVSGAGGREGQEGCVQELPAPLKPTDGEAPDSNQAWVAQQQQQHGWHGQEQHAWQGTWEQQEGQGQQDRTQPALAIPMGWASSQQWEQPEEVSLVSKLLGARANAGGGASRRDVDPVGAGLPSHREVPVAAPTSADAAAAEEAQGLGLLGAYGSDSEEEAS
ncbi:hypothetical protein V8C86DRAFT_3128038 [Haematococcus lacustris]